MKKRLLILSDLWGRDKAAWLIHYTQRLKADFELVYYDCCELGAIDKTNYSQENLHQRFVNGGIERAVKALTETEAETEQISILAFSIGGTIAWKFGLETGRIDSLVCVSSTRLRHETKRPKGNISLYFGNNDPYKPSAAWLEQMNVRAEILKGKEHQLYQEAEFAAQLAKQIPELMGKEIRQDTKR